MRTPGMATSANRCRWLPEAAPALAWTLALGLSLPAWPQAPSPQLAASDPFIKDAKAGYHLRSFYMNQTDTDGTVNQAWAAGGWLYARSGYWQDVLQLGATYYFSLPVYAPAGEGGTQLLRPPQEPIGVLGELYLRARVAQQTLTLYRQEIQMAYAQPSGVRANRSDLSYIGRLDNRMVPVTYQAALLGGPIALPGQNEQQLRYWAGYAWDAKPRDSKDFVSMGEAIGAKGSGAGMSVAGLQWSPMKDLWTQAWFHRADDVLGIVFVDLDHVHRLQDSRYWRFGTQYTQQDAAGGTALSGGSFSTWNWQAYAEFGWQRVKLYGAYSTIADDQQIRTPFSSGPIYTQLVTRNFLRAGEQTVMLGASFGLDGVLPGLSLWLEAAEGRNAVVAGSRTALPDEREVDIGTSWTFREKGAIFDGARIRARAAWVQDDAPDGTQRGTDYRIDLNWPISFL